VEPVSKVLARAVRARRIELGLSVEDAAASANVSAKAWRMMEMGTSQPSLLMLGSVGRALKWTAATIEGLLEDELSVAEGEVVVDLVGPSPDDVESPEEGAFELDVEGLTAAQLAEVQDFIDELRGRPHLDD
jgi:DNA-binding XRE family transcriptional regulator